MCGLGYYGLQITAGRMMAASFGRQRLGTEQWGRAGPLCPFGEAGPVSLCSPPHILEHSGSPGDGAVAKAHQVFCALLMN